MAYTILSPNGHDYCYVIFLALKGTINFFIKNFCVCRFFFVPLSPILSITNHQSPITNHL